MTWEVDYLPEADDDLAGLDGSTRLLALKAIRKTQSNPLASNEGGYGKPLGNKGYKNPAGLLKIKLKSCGIRIVYKLIRREGKMLIVVIGIRTDGKVYDKAAGRVEKYSL